MKPGGSNNNRALEREFNVNLLSGEQTCFESKRIIVTNYRIRLTDKNQSNKELKSIMLEHVTSSRFYSEQQPAFMIIGVIALVIGVGLLAVPAMMGFGFGLIILGVALAACYFKFREYEFFISSPTACIKFKVTETDLSECEELLDKIENAINNRYLSRTFTAQVYRAG